MNTRGGRRTPATPKMDHPTATANGPKPPTTTTKRPTPDAAAPQTRTRMQKIQTGIRKSQI